MSPKQESAKDRRQAAAEAREAQQAAEKRRDRTIKIVGGLAVLLVVGGIVGGALYASKHSSTATPSSALPSPNPNAALPKGVVATGDNAFGVPLGTPKPGAPLLQVWEDFQCPACKATEQANGTGIEDLGASGAAQLVYRPTAFLDTNLADKNAVNGTPDSSHRAIAAWGCAIDAGKTREYHNVIYTNQPDEGVGYTEATLLDFGTKAGITGTAYTTFESCVKAGTYLGWSVNGTQAMTDNKVGGTPAGFINGTELPAGTLADKAKLNQAVADATKK